MLGHSVLRPSSLGLILMIPSRIYTKRNPVESTAPGRYVHASAAVTCSLTGWLQANAIGRSSKTVREFLEKNHKDDMTREESIKLTVKSLLEVVQTGAKNIEISVMESYGKVTVSVFRMMLKSCSISYPLRRTWVLLRSKR